MFCQRVHILAVLELFEHELIRLVNQGDDLETRIGHSIGLHASISNPFSIGNTQRTSHGACVWDDRLGNA